MLWSDPRGKEQSPPANGQLPRALWEGPPSEADPQLWSCLWRWEPSRYLAFTLRRGPESELPS